MSKQLAISASASIFAMAAFVLFASAPQAGHIQEGAATVVAAPSVDRTATVIFDWIV